MRAVPKWVLELLTRDPTDLVVDVFSSQSDEDGFAALYRLHLLDAYAHVRHHAPSTIDDPLLRFMVRASDESDVPAVEGGDVIWDGMFEVLRTESPDEFIERCNGLFRMAFKWDFVQVFSLVYEGPDGEVVRRFPDLKRGLDESAEGVKAWAERQTPKKAPATGGGGCYIATAVYGSYDAYEVMVLREFRDERLAPKPAGRALMRFYYAVSPPLAARLGRVTILRRIARTLLDPVVAALASRKSTFLR